MSEHVKVDDIEVLRGFRVALIKFAQATAQALSNADGTVGRMRFWLESEQPTYWQGQLRKRADMAAKARDAVRQKKMYTDFNGNTRSAADEIKELQKCQLAQEEAEHKIEMIRRWLPKLEREADTYRGGVARLSEVVNVDLTKALALLDRMAGALEAYVQVEGVAGAVPADGPEEAPEGGMARGGADETSPAPTQGADQPPHREARDVIGGQ